MVRGTKFLTCLVVGTYQEIRGSAVCRVTRQRAGRSRDRISVRTRNFSFFLKAQMALKFRAQTTSYSVGIGVLSFKIRRPERKFAHSTPSSAKVGMVVTTLLPPIRDKFVSLTPTCRQEDQSC